MLAQRRDDLNGQGTYSQSKGAFALFSKEEIIDRAMGLGVSLGHNSKERCSAAKHIIDSELSHALTILKHNTGNLDGQHNSLISQVSQLCEDLVDECSPTSEEFTESGVQCTKISRPRRRKSYDKTNIRRSTRIRVKKLNGRTKRDDLK
jgi:hypothetical protein